MFVDAMFFYLIGLVELKNGCTYFGRNTAIFFLQVQGVKNRFLFSGYLFELSKRKFYIHTDLTE